MKQTVLLILKIIGRTIGILGSAVGAGGAVSGTLSTEHAIAFIGFGSVARQIILVTGDILDDGQENNSFSINGNGQTLTGTAYRGDAPTAIINPPKQ